MSAGSGGLSVSRFAGALLSSDDPVAAGFARTLYGLRFLALMNAIIPAGGLVRPRPAPASAAPASAQKTGGQTAAAPAASTAPASPQAAPETGGSN